MARADELNRRRPDRGAVRRAALLWCLGGALVAHLALLGLAPPALHEWLQDRLPARAPAAPVALRVRHLSSAVAVTPQEARAAPQAKRGPASVPGAKPQPAAEPAPAAQAGVEPAVYVPRALLSVAPVARAPVLLQWPANWLSRSSYTAILKLYLDEEGRVERVEPDGDAKLPEPLFEAARQAFMAAGFTPGQLHGQAVKSWIRVEVSFENGSPASSP